MSSLKRKSDVGAADASKKPKVNGSITSFFGAPKTTAAKPGSGSTSTPNGGPVSTNPATKFDKAAWVATLNPEQKQCLALEINTLDPSWLALLKDEIVKPEFIALKKFIQKEIQSGQTVFPPSDDVYSWSRHTPFHTVKCVILGQDPYHNHNQAHGLCFSVRPPTPAPPSLKNMYTALKKDYPSFVAPPKNGGLLTPWAERGVLMLNTCLTVRAHAANSHQKRGWEALTQKVIDLVAQKRTRGVVFLAWGKPAGDRVAKVDGKRHLVLKSVHPSPLSASRGFFDCGHFRKANEWLLTRYGPDGEIDWNLNADGVPTTSAATAKKTDSSGTKVKNGEVTPVVAVGKAGGAKEESDILEKQGEEGESG
ncbi:uracil-DNA glycosylase [Nemania sp. FL0916]|nr:uracil-DNA glycosylase [Nemania sp. FL0916]